jgi:hypothetical protein
MPNNNSQISLRISISHTKHETNQHTQLPDYKYIQNSKITITSGFDSLEAEAYLYAYMTQTTVFMTQHQNSCFSLTKVSRSQERYANLNL